MLTVGLKPKAPTLSKKLLAMDRSMNGLRRDGVAFAFDRESVRRVDDDGHMHVQVSNISKANVCPYWGREIPDYEALGLDANKQYKLYRDPDELAKAAPTFNNKPLLSRHVEINSDDHPDDLVIGSTGTDAEFDHPHLRNSLVVWKSGAIKDIESERKKELSSAYRYRADMTPGTSPEGEAYDGVMRDMVGNHVALVTEGRAGADVVVGDSMENLMSKKIVMSRKALFVAGAVLGALAPKMAQDAQVDISPLFAGLTAKNYKEKTPGIIDGLKKALTGKLAQDESLEDVVALLDKLGGVKTGEDDLDANTGTPPTVRPDDPSLDHTDDAEKKRMEFLKGKLSAEDMATYDSMIGKAKDEAEETDEEKKAREKKEAEEKAAKDGELPEALKKAEKAMDEKIAKVRADFRGVQDALRKVRPLVGELAIGFDSAEEVYRHVLKMKGIKNHDTMHADALPMALDMQIEKATAAKRPAADKPIIAADEASTKGFEELYGKDAGSHIRVA